VLIPWAEVRTVGEEIGLGVFAGRLIPAGTVVWVEDSLDTRIPVATVRALGGPMREAVYRAAYRPHGAGYYLLCWDGAKYVNHACEPNCLSVMPGLEIAVRDIAPGEQLGNHYAFFGLEAWEIFDCRCGAASCTGRIDLEPSPALLRHRHALVEAARRRAAGVVQPLAPLLGPEPSRLLGPHHLPVSLETRFALNRPVPEESP
jgi:hypothetical protein